MTPHGALVIGVGLSNTVLSPDRKYSDHPDHVGPDVAGRLLGRGRLLGEGPLPTFLRQCAAGRDAGMDLSVAVLRANASESDGLLGLLRDAHPRLTDISTSDDDSSLLAGLMPLLGEVGRRPRILIVGCHTETNVLALATCLRSVAGCTEVAVCPTLVGSATHAAHLSVLRHTLHGLGVAVLLDHEDLATYVGFPAGALASTGARPCEIGPPDAATALEGPATRIAQLLCLQWSRAEFQPLAGGFSGSLLFVASGWKGGARTEPMVIKIDEFGQMRRELRGYYSVKELLGKHVPTFGYPVTLKSLTGVGMELAAMEGRPTTLQATFEAATDERATDLFFRRLDKALELLDEKLYRNTLEPGRLVPYRALGLHSRQQLEWLEENADTILDYLAEASTVDLAIDSFDLCAMVRLAVANEDVLTTEHCINHGDLNFANIICDEGDNTWFIDWTHCGHAPAQLDFAKLENDVKFVMSKDFELEDLPRLQRFEEYLLTTHMPA
ncbi:MAG: phosphotransferase, partial [Myxococcales bacterium]|nr:phosphotransferase [Myxococcales bacterium]